MGGRGAEKRQATERAAQLAKRRKVVSLEDFKKKFAESEVIGSSPIIGF